MIGGVSEAAQPVIVSQRERILATARRQLFTLGYQALTMDALAAELGVSKKTLYVHFAAKEQLVDAVIDPADTRREIAAALEVLVDKREVLGGRKHGNSPL